MWKYSGMWVCSFAWTIKCKKVIAWSGDFGMDQYVSWCLPAEELTLDTIWGKFEEFCKPLSSVDEWYNTVQAQVNLAKYPPEMANILYRDIFWLFPVRWICIQNNQWWECRFRQVPSKQGASACKKNGEFQSHCMSYQTSCRWSTSSADKSFFFKFM